MLASKHNHTFSLICKNLFRAKTMDLGVKIKETPPSSNPQVITEGSATIKTQGNVFYNPVQEFNRDLSITAINVYARDNLTTKHKDIVIPPAGKGCQDGLTILEALSATGLRSIRYAKEIRGVREIVANDISKKAVEDINGNIRDNGVESLVKSSLEDATMLMYKSRQNKVFDVIDLDPYGCPSLFLDSAVQAIKDGGLLLVTATDMAVLAGNAPETCYSKYGSISLRSKACHEIALRILLRCIESHANRYGRFIEPLLSLSADFYIRVFVKVHTGPNKCKRTLSKLATVYHCTGCGSHVIKPLGTLKVNEKNNQPKYCLPTTSLDDYTKKCEHCDFPYHIGGPIWNAPIHDLGFVEHLLRELETTELKNLGTFKRLQGTLSLIKEELVDYPLYFTLEQLSGTLHVEMPSMVFVRSAILNAGYKVSYTHMNKTSIKTSAPSHVVWDIMRTWESQHPVSEKRKKEQTPAYNILNKQRRSDHDFSHHPGAEPESKKLGFLRFQQNPQPNWGPGTRATAMVGDKSDKKIRNQGKRKREASPDLS